MKTPLALAVLAICAAGGADAQMPPDRPRLDAFVDVARHHAARQFQIPPQNLWFSELRLDYNEDGLADDSAAAPRRIVVTFFDPDSAAPDSDHPNVRNADAYSVPLSPRGALLAPPSRRCVGWTP
ncbi:MAG: hypothetical protein AB7V14_11235 [Kiritimatiellia bacterium]